MRQNYIIYRNQLSKIINKIKDNYQKFETKKISDNVEEMWNCINKLNNN